MKQGKIHELYAEKVDVGRRALDDTGEVPFQEDHAEKSIDTRKKETEIRSGNAR
jgi:hypothetical protein